MIRAVKHRYLAAYSGLPREVWLLALVMFVNRCGTMVLPFLTIYLTSELDVADATAGRMISVYGVGAVLGSYLGGLWSKRLGALRVQIVCTFLSVPVLLVIPLWSTLPQFAASLFAWAVIYEAVRPANATAIASFTNTDNRARAFALQRLAANLGFSFGPAIGGYLATVRFGLLFVVDALTTLIAAAILLRCFRLPAKPTEPTTDDDTAERSPLTDRHFVSFLALLLLTQMVFMQFLSTYPLYLHDHYQLGTTQIGLLFAVNTSIIVVFEMVLVDTIKHRSTLRIIGLGCALCCLGFGMLPFGSSGLLCVAAMVVVTIGEMLCFPTASAYVANYSPEGREASYMGWYMVTHSVAWVLGPAIGATIYGLNREALWLSAIGVGALVLMGFKALEKSSLS